MVFAIGDNDATTKFAMIKDIEVSIDQSTFFIAFDDTQFNHVISAWTQTSNLWAKGVHNSTTHKTLTLSPNQNFLIMTDYSALIELDASTGSLIKYIKLTGFLKATAIAISPDSIFIFLGGSSAG